MDFAASKHENETFKSDLVDCGVHPFRAFNSGRSARHILRGIHIFSFNSPSTFPTLGSSLYWWLFARNVLIILLLHTMCLYVVAPNRDRLAMLYFDMKKIDPDLAYIGVFHRIRKGIVDRQARDSEKSQHRSIRSSKYLEWLLCSNVCSCFLALS